MNEYLYKLFGLLLCAAFTAAGIAVGRAHSRQPVEAEPEEAEDDQFTYRTDPELGAVPGAWAKGKE